MYIDDRVLAHGYEGVILDFWKEGAEIKYVRVLLDIGDCKEWYAVAEVEVITES